MSLTPNNKIKIRKNFLVEIFYERKYNLFRSTQFKNI